MNWKKWQGWIGLLLLGLLIAGCEDALPDQTNPLQDASQGSQISPINITGLLPFAGSVGAGSSYYVVNGLPASAPVTVDMTIVSPTGDVDLRLFSDPLFTVSAGCVPAAGTAPESCNGTTSATGDVFIQVVNVSGGIVNFTLDIPGGPPPPPAQPVGVAAAPGNTQNTISWTNDPAATSYNIYWNTVGGVTTADAFLTIAASPITHTLLTNGTPYFYRVEAVNAGGASPLSLEVSATPTAAPPPAPTLNPSTAGDTQVTLSWSNVGATTYNVYWEVAPAIPTTASVTNSLGIIGLTTNITGLTNGTVYNFIVTGVNGGGEGLPSNMVAGTPIISTPTGVGAATAGTTVNVSWTAVPGATSYNVYFGTVTGVTTASPLAGIPLASPFAHTGLANDTTYFYVVTAVDAGSESLISAEVNTITVPAAPTGLSVTPGDAQNTLTWANSPSTVSNNIYWSTTTPTPTTVTGTLIGGATSGQVHAGLINWADYYYIVTAVNAGGESLPTAVVPGMPQQTAAGCPPDGSNIDALVNAGPFTCTITPFGTFQFLINLFIGNSYEFVVRTPKLGQGDVDFVIADSFLIDYADSSFLDSGFGLTERVMLDAPTTDEFTFTIDEFATISTDLIIEIRQVPTPGAPAGVITAECNLRNLDNDLCGGGRLFYRNSGINSIVTGLSNVMLVVADQPEVSFVPYKIGQTATANANDFTDGRDNLGTFNPAHPASDACQTLVLNGFTDWYLPSQWELHELEQAMLGGLIVPITMGTMLAPAWYWASTEYELNPAEAYQIAFNGNFDSTFTNWLKDSAIASDSYVCIRRPIL